MPGEVNKYIDGIQQIPVDIMPFRTIADFKESVSGICFF